MNVGVGVQIQRTSWSFHVCSHFLCSTTAREPLLEVLASNCTSADITIIWVSKCCLIGTCSNGLSCENAQRLGICLVEWLVIVTPIRALLIISAALFLASTWPSTSCTYETESNNPSILGGKGKGICCRYNRALIWSLRCLGTFWWHVVEERWQCAAFGARGIKNYKS